jgi:hypothetical protein
MAWERHATPEPGPCPAGSRAAPGAPSRLWRTKLLSSLTRQRAKQRLFKLSPSLDTVQPPRAAKAQIEAQRSMQGADAAGPASEGGGARESEVRRFAAAVLQLCMHAAAATHLRALQSRHLSPSDASHGRCRVASFAAASAKFTLCRLSFMLPCTRFQLCGGRLRGRDRLGSQNERSCLFRQGERMSTSAGPTSARSRARVGARGVRVAAAATARPPAQHAPPACESASLRRDRHAPEMRAARARATAGAGERRRTTSRCCACSMCRQPHSGSHHAPGRG